MVINNIVEICKMLMYIKHFFMNKNIVIQQALKKINFKYLPTINNFTWADI